MARAITANMATAFSGDIVRPIIMIDLNFSSPIYLWSGNGTLAYNFGSGSNDYLGAGDVVKMSSIEETTDLGATGITLDLTGIKDTTLLNKALTEDYQGKTVTMYLGAVDENNAVIQNPLTIFAGFMDVLTISEGGETATISLKVENKLITLDRNRVSRYTSQDQRAKHPTDKGFDYVTNIAEKDITWGAQTEKAAKQNLQ